MTNLPNGARILKPGDRLWMDNQYFSDKQKFVIQMNRFEIKKWCGEETAEQLMVLKDRWCDWVSRKQIMDDVFVIKNFTGTTNEQKTYAAERLKKRVQTAFSSKLSSKYETS